MTEQRTKEERLHVCPDCKCQFVQPFVCTTCGAQKLYDVTVHSQARTIAHLRSLLRECLEAWEGTGPGIVLDRIRQVVEDRPL
jgi:hypothetical protein